MAKESETREIITALFFKGHMKTRKEEPEIFFLIEIKKKMKDDTNTFFFIDF